MFSVTQILLRPLKRLALTTKRARKGFYKGNRIGAMGRHTRRGGYSIAPEKVRTYVVPRPDPNFMLTPFVTELSAAPRVNVDEGRRSVWRNNWKLSGAEYLAQWKRYNRTET